MRFCAYRVNKKTQKVTKEEFLCFMGNFGFNHFGFTAFSVNGDDYTVPLLSQN